MRPRERNDWDVLREEIATVFSPGAPIDEGELFAGRPDQIRELIDAGSQRGQHAIVFGERGVGKTSLANTFTKFMHRPVSRLAAMGIPETKGSVTVKVNRGGLSGMVLLCGDEGDQSRNNTPR